MQTGRPLTTEIDSSLPATNQNGGITVDGELHSPQTYPLYHCAQANCDGMWNWDGPATENVRCPKCSKVNCLACQAIHGGVSCVQYLTSLIDAIDKGALEDGRRKMKRLQEHIDLYQKDLISNPVPFSCILCSIQVEPEKGVQLKNCHHMLCKSCVTSAIRRSATTAVKCPFRNMDEYCKMDVSFSEIKALLSAEEYEDYLERSLLEVKVSVKDYFHCRAPGCAWWCFYEPGLPEIMCKLCRSLNCLKCEVIHKGESCEQYRASKMQILPVPRRTPEENMRLFFICCFHVSYIACIAYFILKCLFFDQIDVAFPPYDPDEEFE